MSARLYAKAIRWIVNEDDCEWLRGNPPVMSIAASMVQDIFKKTREDVFTDLVAELRHIFPNSWHGKLPWE